MFSFITDLAEFAHQPPRAASAVILALLPWSLFGQTTRTIQKGLPIPSEASNHPGVDDQFRAACIHNSRPPEANEELRPAIEPLRQTLERFEQQLRFKRILEAISSEEMYYRWGAGASGAATDKPNAGGGAESRYGSNR